MRMDRSWIGILLATMRIVPGMDDYIDGLKEALQDRGRPGVEPASDGGYDVDVPDDIWFGLVSSAIARTTVMSDDSWAEMLSDVRRSGLKAAQASTPWTGHWRKGARWCCWRGYSWRRRKSVEYGMRRIPYF